MTYVYTIRLPGDIGAIGVPILSSGGILSCIQTISISLSFRFIKTLRTRSEHPSSPLPSQNEVNTMVCTQKRHARLLAYLSPLSPTPTRPSPSTSASGSSATTTSRSRSLLQRQSRCLECLIQRTPRNSSFTGTYRNFTRHSILAVRLNLCVRRRGGGAYEQNKEWRSTSFDTRKLSNTDPAIEVQ